MPQSIRYLTFLYFLYTNLFFKTILEKLYPILYKQKKDNYDSYLGIVNDKHNPYAYRFLKS